MKLGTEIALYSKVNDFRQIRGNFSPLLLELRYHYGINTDFIHNDSVLIP
jgi:hypothetical protein